MELTVELHDEEGKRLSESIVDDHSRLHRYLTMTNDTSVLSGIDWCGETTFTRLQMRQLLPAWKELIEAATDDADKAFLKDVLRLLQKVCETFIGTSSSLETNPC